MKVFEKLHLSQDDEDNIAREVAILQSIHHPNIIKIINYYNEENFYYIVLELAEGGELFDRIIMKEYYNEKDARDVILTLINAIKFCHDNDIIHRDLKPENILLLSKDEDTHIKIADFGFATKSHGHSLHEYMGSKGYIAPEILERKNYGKEVDMWAIGVITFILLSGYPPFGEDSKEEMKHAEFAFNVKYWSNVSDDAKDFIKALIKVDPEQRLTATACLEHKWLKVPDHHISSNTLDSTLEELRKYQSVKKLRIAVKVGLVVNKLKHKMLDHFHKSHDEVHDNNSDKRSAEVIEEADSTTDDINSNNSKKQKV